MSEFEDMTDEELIENESRAKRIQVNEIGAGNHQAALEVARERVEMWKEACARGLTL